MRDQTRRKTHPTRRPRSAARLPPPDWNLPNTPTYLVCDEPGAPERVSLDLRVYGMQEYLLNERQGMYHRHGISLLLYSRHHGLVNQTKGLFTGDHYCSSFRHTLNGREFDCCGASFTWDLRLFRHQFRLLQ